MFGKVIFVYYLLFYLYFDIHMFKYTSITDICSIMGK